MPKEDRPFPVLLREIRDGSESAIRQLVAEFSPGIVRTIRRRLDARLRGKVGCDDLLQEVWTAFFTKALPNEEFSSPKSLAAYLKAMAINKTVEADRKWLDHGRHDVKREQSLEGLARADQEQLLGKQPLPPVSAESHEDLERLRNTLPAKYQLVVDLLLTGHTQEEIAARLGLSDRTVRRILCQLKRPPPAPG
jgi:RNA polymerase sigma-70 factor (ECF subfamily)